MIETMQRVNNVFKGVGETISGLSLLLIRLYLFPVMAQAGWQKLSHFNDTVSWFGDVEYGLGLPLPWLMTVLAITAELVGAVFILLGFATRWASIPLMVTMLVAIFTVHAEHGWLAIADANSWLADGTILLNESVMAAPEKLAAARSLLDEHGYIDWLTSSGNFVILNNGIEFAATYFVMLFVLFCFGGGRYVSADYFINQYFSKKDALDH